MLLEIFISKHILFLPNIGVGGLVLIALVVLLLFGGKKVPELMRGLGQGMKEFKDATKEDKTKEKKDK
jgi:sec-independent protein translocase protein TatA